MNLFIDPSDPINQLFIMITLETVLVIVILIVAVIKIKKQPLKAKDEKPRFAKPKAEAPRRKPWRHKRGLPENVAYILLLMGTLALVTSILYSSSILAFIGLGLTFWGALLLFIRPTKYVKASLVDSTAVSSLTSLDQIITELNFKGKAVYLPPKHLKETRGGKLFIPSKKELIIPTTEEAAEEKVFLRNPKGIRLTPPGLGLANLYEKELRKNFTKVNLNYLQNNLPKLFIEDLEIAEDFEMNIEDNKIQVKITGSIYNDLCNEVRKLSNTCSSFGCPLCSSIAVALTRATGKPVLVENIEVSDDDKTIEAHYRLIEE
jgi:hypothetical protein